MAAPRRGDLVGAMVLFATLNFALIAINGERHGGDTPLYLDGAARLLDGRPLIDREPSYTGYIAVVAAAQAIGIGTFGVVVLQVTLGAVAAAVVFAIGAALAGRVAGAVAVLLLSLDVDTNRWHQFVLADSVYTSLFVIGVWLTHRSAVARNVEPIVSAGAVMVGAALVRPEGWFLLPAAAAYVIVTRIPSNRHRFAAAAALAGGALAVVAVLAPRYQGNMQAVGPADMLQRGQTIWDFEGWRVAMPAADAPNGDQAGSAIGYALRHPFSTLKLMIARVAVHFAHVRPFYSTAHNVVIVLWLLPVYAATVFAITHLGTAPLALWLVAAIASQTVVVALTHAEWDGRYLAHVLPLVYIFVGAAIAIWRAKSSSDRRGSFANA
ncbi:MAG TPA: glycosyltransferase family 39 protein [Vicinamibacterales bacterium]|nr:glycosyltransferase family 39 protein [Vicinamibacterales bacterium]